MSTQLNSRVDSPLTLILAATCNIIYDDKIKKEDWMNVLNHVVSKIKPINYKFANQNIEKELKKAELNLKYPQNFNMKFISSNYTDKDILLKAVDWVANVNENSEKIIAIKDKERVIRALLAEAIVTAKKYMLNSSKLTIDNEKIISYAVLSYNYANNPDVIRKKMGWK